MSDFWLILTVLVSPSSPPIYDRAPTGSRPHRPVRQFWPLAICGQWRSVLSMSSYGDPDPRLETTAGKAEIDKEEGDTASGGAPEEPETKNPQKTD